MQEIHTDVAVIGGGLGGCAAAMAAASLGRRVVLTDENMWIGGQLTSQAVPPDGHRWIESFGSTVRFRTLRHRIREYYRAHLPLTYRARSERLLNPGNGWVSRLCHDPRIAVGLLLEMMAAYEYSGQLVVLRMHEPVAAEADGDRIASVTMKDLRYARRRQISASVFVDATPTGDLLELADVEHVIGAESRADTGEPHAADVADPDNQQAFTFCFAMDLLPGQDHTIDEPEQYAHFRDLRPAETVGPPSWPGKLLSWRTVRPETNEPLNRRLFESEDGLSWWAYRRILDRSKFEAGFAESDITVVNWPQNDYWFGPIVGVDAHERDRHLDAARQLSLSLLYWMQTEAPRPDGGTGYPGLRLRGDVMGDTDDGLAPAPYVRESRRIRAELTVLEQHIAHPLRPKGPEVFQDSVGIGSYRIDLHPTATGAPYIDLGCWPFQIPLGAMIPVRVDNLIPGSKNIGTTHITNGAYRVHPVEWNIGEVAGLLSAFCIEHDVPPRAVRSRERLLRDFQALLVRQGVELAWPSVTPL